MPVASMKAPGASDEAVGLTGGQIWYLADYVRSLPFEKINQVGGAKDAALEPIRKPRDGQDAHPTARFPGRLLAASAAVAAEHAPNTSSPTSEPIVPYLQFRYEIIFIFSILRPLLPNSECVLK